MRMPATGFKIMTSHPIGMRTFSSRDAAVRMAATFGVPNPEASVVTTGRRLIRQRSK